MFKIQRLAFILACFILMCSIVVQTNMNLEPVKAVNQETSVKQIPAKLEVDIFSGLPNPQWELTTAEMQAFDDLLPKLPIIKKVPPSLPSLGFRGVIVTRKPGVSYLIYKDMMWSLEAKPSIVYQDPDQVLKTWSLATSKQHLPADLYAVLEQNN